MINKDSNHRYTCDSLSMSREELIEYIKKKERRFSPDIIIDFKIFSDNELIKLKRIIDSENNKEDNEKKIIDKQKQKDNCQSAIKIITTQEYK